MRKMTQLGPFGPKRPVCSPLNCICIAPFLDCTDEVVGTVDGTVSGHQSQRLVDAVFGRLEVRRISTNDASETMAFVEMQKSPKRHRVDGQ